MKRILLGAVLPYASTIYAQKRQAPAYPLITHDPYFSIWSANDSINAGG